MVKWLEVNSTGKQQIQVTDGYLYLGITFTPSGSFSLAQKKPYNKGTRSLYIYNGASVSTVLKLFYSLVSQSFCSTVKFGVDFLKSVRNNYDKFVSRIFDERITPKNMHNKLLLTRYAKWP